MSQDLDGQGALTPAENKLRLWSAMLDDIERSIIKGHFAQATPMAMNLLTTDDVPTLHKAMAAVALGDVAFARGLFGDAQSNFMMATLLLQPFKDDPDTDEYLKTCIKQVERKLNRATKLRDKEDDPGLDETNDGEPIPRERHESFAEFHIRDQENYMDEEDMGYIYPDSEDMVKDSAPDIGTKDSLPTSRAPQLVADEVNPSKGQTSS